MFVLGARFTCLTLRRINGLHAKRAFSPAHGVVITAAGRDLPKRCTGHGSCAPDGQPEPGETCGEPGPNTKETNVALRDILVLIDAETKAAGPYGLALAAAAGASATGAFMVAEPNLARYAGLGLPKDVIEAADGRARDLAAQHLADFEAAAKLAGVPAETLAIAGSLNPEGELARLAGHFDLMVVEQADPDSMASGNRFAEAVLFGSGRPILMVPYIQRARPVLGKVLVAWDGGRASARALGDAMPLLSKAEKVELISVQRAGDTGVELPGFNIARHLARHGINVELQKLVTTMDIANTILSHASDSGADLLVMGGYGHSKLREMVLGGTTRTIMKSMTLPTFFSH
ncbi:universal stress protein [Phreatobacter aquaticus]|uniref:Universal stress protein n=1 Tax=Phreatobacter aquaticus TaxID=2570229 RepID=A0A4D7QGH0_9HYPH|nr:universal stress protein [Phreatobacter aquaticus]